MVLVTGLLVLERYVVSLIVSSIAVVEFDLLWSDVLGLLVVGLLCLNGLVLRRSGAYCSLLSIVSQILERGCSDGATNPCSGLWACFATLCALSRRVAASNLPRAIIGSFTPICDKSVIWRHMGLGKSYII